MFSYKLKLMIIIGLFGLLLACTVSFVDQWRFTNQLMKDYSIQTSLIEDNVVTAISDVDKAHRVLEKRLEEKMQVYSMKLLDKYQAEPNLDRWDYDALKESMDGMDVYLINREHVITHSSYATDIGMNFTEVAPDMAKGLKHILDHGKFVVDGMDAETNTGKIRKYSYMPTPDGKYVIELGYMLTGTRTFELFNFVNVIEEMKRKYKKLDNVIVYSADGKSLGSVDGKGHVVKLTEEFDHIFKKASGGKRVVQEIHSDGVIHKFIPYIIHHKDSVRNYTDLRIIKISYNVSHLNEVIRENRHIFWIQLYVILGVTLLIAFLITRVISKPMYLASYDLLTGLFNRPAFYTHLEYRLKRIKKSGGSFPVLMLDLDNFKLINDTLGHDGGDQLLKLAARRIEAVILNGKDIIARLGGDEFGIILDNMRSEEDAKEIARQILLEFDHSLIVKERNVIEDFNVSASIGIVMVPEHGEDLQTIYENCDIAMYRAKNSGKNTFKVYDSQYDAVDQ